MNKLSLFIGLQVADFLTTVGCLHVGLPESNPVTLRLMSVFGVYGGLAAAKLLCCGIASYRPWRFLWAASSVYLLVVLWNLFLFGLFGVANGYF